VKDIKTEYVAKSPGQLAKVDVIELANYLLARYKSVPNLKLQKLVYFIEAYHLGYFKEPLTNAKFQAWLHGPVSRKLYEYIKPSGGLLYSDISLNWEPDKQAHFIKDFEAKLNPTQLELINDILKEFADLSSYQLECISHDELPWIEARKGYGIADNCEVEISNDTMLKFYRERIFAGQ
jgi:uncharacterized phage-associated protein